MQVNARADGRGVGGHPLPVGEDGGVRHTTARHVARAWGQRSRTDPSTLAPDEHAACEADPKDLLATVMDDGGPFASRARRRGSPRSIAPSAPRAHLHGVSALAWGMPALALSPRPTIASP